MQLWLKMIIENFRSVSSIIYKMEHNPKTTFTSVVVFVFLSACQHTDLILTNSHYFKELLTRNLASPNGWLIFGSDTGILQYGWHGCVLSKFLYMYFI